MGHRSLAVPGLSLRAASAQAPDHTLTLIQLVCPGRSVGVKVSAWGMLFPLFIAALVPIRFGLGGLFDRDHLEVLDAEEDPAEESESWS